MITVLTEHGPKTLEELHFDNSYARLPPSFYSPHRPTPLRKAHLAHFNSAAAASINLHKSEASRNDLVDIITGLKPLTGFDPIACCYAGHQFGHLVPRLGDGRAILLGEVVDDNGSRCDLHLKGAGLTAYSRQGDGRAVLRSSIREYLCSEAMHNLGIGTSRALCLISSSEAVYRERVEPAAAVLRMAPSHIRFGTFEYFYYAQRFKELRTLADYTLKMHFPHLLEYHNPYLSLLAEVIENTARLIAQWQAMGFMHGVMNTDNMSIHSITLDYGPFGFMETFHSAQVCNHSDHGGRYAFDQQPRVALFNLGCLAQAMVPLLAPQPEKSADLAALALQKYWAIYEVHYAAAMRARLGLETSADDDRQLYQSLYVTMQKNEVDLTRFFRALSQTDAARRHAQTRALFARPEDCDEWMQLYNARLAREACSAELRCAKMRRVNPVYVLRNYMAEIAIRKAEDEGDYSEIDRLMTLLATPYDEHPEARQYAAAAPSWADQLVVSCSS